MSVRVTVANASSQIGGAELSLLPVLRRLADRAEVVVHLPGQGPLHGELDRLGIATRPFPLSPELVRASRQYGTTPSLGLAVSGLRQQAAVLRGLVRERPDVVYCNGFRAQLAYTGPALVSRVPSVWHVRDLLSNGGGLGRAWSVLARRAATVIANSQATAHQPLLQGAHVVAIPNGIDLARFTPRDGEPEGMVVGMAAHLTPWKGHRRFLRVVAALLPSFPDLRARIAGGERYDTAPHDAYAAELDAEIAALGLTEVVELTDVPAASMPDWLRGLHVLVHCPDRPEPFGRVLAEAMAVGVPVVAAAGPGAEEVVADAGILLPLEAAQAVTGAVAALLASPSRRKQLAQAGVERAHAQFDEDAYAERTVVEILAAARGRGYARSASDS